MPWREPRVIELKSAPYRNCHRPWPMGGDPCSERGRAAVSGASGPAAGTVFLARAPPHYPEPCRGSVGQAGRRYRACTGTGTRSANVVAAFHWLIRPMAGKAALRTQRSGAFGRRFAELTRKWWPGACVVEDLRRKVSRFRSISAHGSASEREIVRKIPFQAMCGHAVPPRYFPRRWLPARQSASGGPVRIHARAHWPVIAVEETTRLSPPSGPVGREPPIRCRTPNARNARQAGRRTISRASYRFPLDAPAGGSAEVADGTPHTCPRPAAPHALAGSSPGTDLPESVPARPRTPRRIADN